MSIEDDNQVNIKDRHFFLTSTQQATLVWNRDGVVPSETGVDPANLLVNVTLYNIKGDGESIIEEVGQIATGLDNTGEALITVPTAASGNYIDYCAFSLTFYDGPDQKTVVSDSSGSPIGRWCTQTWVAFSQPNEIDDLLFNKCNEWAITEPLPYIRQELLTRTAATPCPPTVVQARTPNSGLVKENQQHFVEYFHAGAGECYRQRTITA